MIESGITKRQNLPTLIGRLIFNPMLMLSFASVFAGCGAAALRGNFEIFPASLCLIFALLSQMAGSLWYYYSEMRLRLDEGEVDSGFGSMQRSSVLREATFAFLIMDGIVALALLTMAGWWALLVGVVAAPVVYLTFGTSKPLARSAWGLLSTWILFGPVCVIGTSLIQSGHEANSLINFYDIEPSLYICLTIGFLAVNCQLVHHTTEMEADKEIGRRTLSVVCGLKATRIIFIVNSLIATAAVEVLWYIQNQHEWWIYVIIPGLSLAVDIWTATKLRASYKVEPKRLQLIANLNLLLMAVAIMVIAFFIGASDDSALQYF